VIFLILTLQNEIDAREPTYENLVNEGPKWVQDESDLQQQSLKEQLDSIESGWKDLHELSDARQKQLLQSLNYQVRLFHKPGNIVPETLFSSHLSQRLENLVMFLNNLSVNLLVLAVHEGRKTSGFITWKTRIVLVKG
jgi:hypothetical protein